MKLIPSLVVAAGLFSALPASAAPVTLNFDDQTSFSSLSYSESLYGFYANGALLALANDGLGTGPNNEYFSHNPSGSNVMFAFGPLPNEFAALISTAGFQDSVTFQYSANTTGTVFARDAAGNVISQIELLANSAGTSEPYSIWSSATLNFSGLATFIDFGSATDAVFDNVTVNPVPLPAAALLFPFGLAAMRLAARKRKEA